MEYFPPALEKMVEQFARLPGIGHKTAQRLAFFVLSLPENEVEQFAQAILEAKRSIALCPVCQNLTEGEGLCPICASEKRDGSVVCVVADPKDVIAMERAREYHGTYHVLHGVLSPMNGVGPDDPVYQIPPGPGGAGGDSGGHYGDKSRHGGRGHGHVSVPYAQAVRCKGDPSGLWCSRGGPLRIC